MTWIHFKSAVTHPGLAPGLSTRLPRRCRPLGPSPAGTVGCQGSPALPPRPPYCAARGARAVARSPHHASSARSPTGPRRLFPAADEVALGAGAMLPRQHRHTQPRAGSPCCSLGPGLGPGTGDGLVPATTAPEHTTGSSSLLPAAWITTASPRGNTCPGHPTSPQGKSPGKLARQPGPAAGITPRPGTSYRQRELETGSLWAPCRGSQGF